MVAVRAQVNATQVENFVRNVGRLAVAIEEHVQQRERQAILRVAREVFVRRIDVVDDKANERVYLSKSGGALIMLLNNVYIRHIRGDVSEGPSRDGRGGPVVSRIKGTVPRSFFLRRGRNPYTRIPFDLTIPIPAQRLGNTPNPIRVGGPDLTEPIPDRSTLAVDVLNAIAASGAVRVSIRRGFAQVFSNV